MKRYVLARIAVSLVCLPLASLAQQPAAPTLPVKVLMQGPADTDTELQIFCLFRSSPVNKLNGALVETNDKLHGLLADIRQKGLFNGELGETVLVTPPANTLKAHRVLIIGLGDSQTFTPERMYLVGKIALLEADRLGVAHPFFAPTVIDGGITKYTTGEVATHVVQGFRDALALEQQLNKDGAAAPPSVVDVTYLAGAKFAANTQAGIDQALSTPTAK